MQSIGERLEETRKRKGISLREAAEATKIRSDYLGKIEQNQFDFELPEIYKRGFLKNYARYLKLDPENILSEYSAGQQDQAGSGKKSGSELFGTMAVKDADTDAADSAEPSYGRISANRTSSPSDTDAHAEDESDDSDKIFYIKAGLIAVGTLALVFIIFGLIKAILGSDSDLTVDAPEQSDPPAISERVETAETAETLAPAIVEDSITLIASGNVYVLVKQRNDKQELFRKTMSAGETVELSKSGPVDILFTAGENIVIDHAGERLRPSSSGTAKISIP
jgi:cytoskeleton protein RodZ